MDIQKHLSSCFEKNGIIFAFSEKQFEEGKEEGVQYSSLGGGLMCPVNNIKAYIQELSTILREGREKEKASKTKEQIIEALLSNHECYYIGDISDAVEEALAYGYTENDVKTVYFATKNKYD